jgi:hypothetical protein
VLEEIGAGGMGVVYRAHDEQLDRDVALKVLPAGMLADEGARRRFHREALAVARLNHPNVGAVYEFGGQDGIDFLVMELVSGVTLDSRLAAGPLAIGEIIRLGTQLADGLEAAHAEGKDRSRAQRRRQYLPHALGFLPRQPGLWPPSLIRPDLRRPGKRRVGGDRHLRRLPPPAGDDARIDLAESRAAATLGDFKRGLESARRASTKGLIHGSRLVVAQARAAEGFALERLSQLNMPRLHLPRRSNSTTSTRHAWRSAGSKCNLAGSAREVPVSRRSKKRRGRKGFELIADKSAKARG